MMHLEYACYKWTFTSSTMVVQFRLSHRIIQLIFILKMNMHLVCACKNGHLQVAQWLYSLDIELIVQLIFILKMNMHLDMHVIMDIYK